MSLSFLQQHKSLTTKISSLRATRSKLQEDESKGQEKALVAPLETSEPIVLPTEPSKDSDAVCSATKAKSSASDRFNAICSIAKSSIIDAHSIEESRDKAIQDARFKLRIAINKKIVQIANSKQQVSSIVHSLLILFNEARSKFGSQMVNYCVYIFCRKIVVSKIMLQMIFKTLPYLCRTKPKLKCRYIVHLPFLLLKLSLI